MKPSSPEPITLPGNGSGASSGAGKASSAGLAAADAVIRPARLDRPLGRQLLDPGYADAALEGRLELAAARVQESARAQGYAAGWSQGSQAAAARAAGHEQLRAEQLEQQRRAVAGQAQTLLAALAEATRRQQAAGLPDWHEVADALADGALALAAAAVGRELASIDAPLVEAVRVAMRALGDPAQVALHLNPADAGLISSAELPAGVRLVPDAAVAAGSVLLQTPAQRLAYNLPAALAAAEEVLRS
jgi:flagellar assembly protein FliH